MTARALPGRDARAISASSRRGNTIVLVVGILVLLVIIATAFVVRTQAGRTTSAATTSANLGIDNANTIAKDLAEEVSGALFVRAIDTAGLGSPLLVDSNSARLPPSPFALRFLVDETDIFTGVAPGANGRPDFPFNSPPHAVVPWTNPPDFLGGGLGGPNLFWPPGEGNQYLITALPPGSPLRSEYNPLGFPGFGDTRWLRDIEPLRGDLAADSNGDKIPDDYGASDGINETFAYWRHLTNIARPDNGWRIAYNIADLEASLSTNLNIPVEQWPVFSLTRDPGSLMGQRFDANGDAIYPGMMAFQNQWLQWFSSLASYEGIYTDAANVPHNRYHLRALGLPQHEFAGPGVDPLFPAGTDRWSVGRVLADSDGDGFTDSFWFLAPSSIQSGIRTLVAVSVIDNQGMFNANVGTRYIRNDTTGIPRKTGGLSPTDIAVVGQGETQGLPATGVGNFNVGFYDNWANWLAIGEINTAYDTDLVTAGNLWFRHLTEVGLTNAANAPLAFPDVATRLDYWRRSASRSASSDPFAKYTPFGLEDELELRMYAGQNYPWIASRYEFSLSNNINSGGISPMRGDLRREESSEFIDQLESWQLALDSRHRTTLYNGVRNDITVPWLWLYGPNRDSNVDTFVNALDRDLDGDGVQGDLDDVRLFQAGAAKFDLRLPYDQAGGYTVTLPGLWDATLGREFATNRVWPQNMWNGQPGPEGYVSRFAVAVRDRLINALADNLDNLPSNRGTYYGNSPSAIEQTYELAAAYAANIKEWRDREDAPLSAEFGDLVRTAPSTEIASLSEAVAVPPSPTNNAPTARFLGMEPQPFLLEVYIGHVYRDFSDPASTSGAAIVIPATDLNGTPYTNAGQHFVVETDAGGDNRDRSTVIVVQIANPYRRPIALHDPMVKYQVRLFGQEFDLETLDPAQDFDWLPPASEDRPSTLVLYAIKDDINTPAAGTGFHDRWMDFLDISESVDLPPDSAVVRVDTSRWNIDQRDDYDSSTEPAIEIRRMFIPPAPPAGELALPAEDWVVIDRMDAPSARRFGQAINAMESSRPPDYVGTLPALYDGSDDPAGYDYPGLDIGVDGSGYSHWVQWVRATRAWGVDVNNNGGIDPNEVNPRFVFGDYAVATAAGDAAAVEDPLDANTLLSSGDRYKFDDAPDTPWFTRPYTRENPATPGVDEVVKRKPTFFNFNHITGEDPAFPDWSFPNKGWYGQKGTGTPDDVIIAAIASPPPPPAPQVERNYATPFAFQMLHKDSDFEQVGELLNVFLYGHKLLFTNNTATGTFTGTTTTTFSEYLSSAPALAALTGLEDADVRFRVNRLMLSPTNAGGQMGQFVGVGDATAIDDPRHAIPDQPAGVRVLDAFVCDGFGSAALIDHNGSGSVADEIETRTLYNAKNFDGTSSPGMPNINTAPPEVLRALPNMMRLVHETGGITAGQPFYNASAEPLVTTAPNAAAHLPRVMLSEAIDQYRERFNGGGGTGMPTGHIGGPNYEVRSNPRGFASVGELNNLNFDGLAPFLVRAANNGPDTVYPEHWRFDFGVGKQPMGVGAAGTAKPFYNNAALDSQISMRVSTDRQGVWDPFAAVAGTPRVDYVAGDAEEANALFAGISNLVTTRSDVFTVYFKIRTFRQNTSVSPPRWDATNSEYIVDDSRYVMLVDRSGVNKPGDQPKILYMEKLPN